VNPKPIINDKKADDSVDFSKEKQEQENLYKEYMKHKYREKMQEEQEKKAKAVENGDVEIVKTPDTKPKNTNSGVDEADKAR